MLESPIKKWLNCPFSLNTGTGDEESQELRGEGYNENYACQNGDVVREGNLPVSNFLEGGRIKQMAILYGTGKDTDPEVIKVLQSVCDNCRRS